MDRVKGIDGLRALAALAVFAGHANWIKGGGIGVDVFFVISGFVITRVLSREFNSSGRISLPSFYLRRTLRLWPALIVCCAAFVWLVGLKQREWLPSVLYFSNFSRVESGYPRVFSHTWSLAVEEQFYLIWPVVLLVALKYRRGFETASGLAIAACLWRLHLNDDASMMRMFNYLDTRADALMVGAALALCERHWKRIGLLWPAGVAFIAWALSEGAWSSPWLYTWGFPALALSSAVVIAKIAADQRGLMTRLLECRALAGLGVISYAFYVWHFPILYFYAWDYGKPACLVATVLFAWGSWIIVERPIMRNRDILTRSSLRCVPAAQSGPRSPTSSARYW